MNSKLVFHFLMMYVFPHSAFFILIYALVSAYANVRASRELHAKVLLNVLKAPMSFFDTTPSGRILNRFSRDVETVDSILPQLIRNWLNTFFIVFSSIVVIGYSTPAFLAVVVPIGLLYYFIQVRVCDFVGHCPPISSENIITIQLKCHPERLRSLNRFV